MTLEELAAHMVTEAADWNLTEGPEGNFEACADAFSILLRTFAEGVRAEERERCAQVAEQHLEHMDFTDYQNHTDGSPACCIADAIRLSPAKEEVE